MNPGLVFHWKGRRLLAAGQLYKYKGKVVHLLSEEHGVWNFELMPSRERGCAHENEFKEIE